jgi:outer membrane protein assembly factor BamB
MLPSRSRQSRIDVAGHALRSLRIVALAITSLAAGCSWFGGSDKDSKPAPLTDITETLRIKKVWSAGVGGGGESLRLALAPATDGTKLYAAGHGGKVSAFVTDTGRRVWQVKTHLPLAGGPASGGGHVVAGATNGMVIALRADDGHEEWRVSVGSEVIAAPAIGDKSAFVRTVDGRLIALSLADGSQSWFSQQSVPRLSLRGTGAPVIDRDMVICGFDNGRVAAYDTRDGTQIWDVLLDPPAGRTEVERLSDLNSTVRVVGDDIYVIGFQGRISALTRESGQVAWNRDLSGYAGLGADVSNVYAAGDAGQIVAFNRATGEERWRREELRNRDLTAPTPFGGSVVVGDFDGYVHWFDAETGTPQARVRADSSRITAPPLVVNDLLFVQSDDGEVVALRNATPARGK